MVKQRAVLYTRARLGRGRVEATIGTVSELDRPDVSVMIRNGTGAETERFVTRALQIVPVEVNCTLHVRLITMRTTN
jgi:hypothetical protein